MISHARRASLPYSAPVTLFEDVAALGMNLEVGYRSTPDDFEIVHVTRLSDTSDRDDQTEITKWLNDEAMAEIRAVMMAKSDYMRKWG